MGFNLEYHNLKIENLRNLFLSWGYFSNDLYWNGFKTYLEKVIPMNRLIVIQKDNEIEALITFFITNDYERLYKKGSWEIPSEDPDGTQVYIDKMIARKWTPSLRRCVQEMLESKFSNTTEAYWHREPFDRLIRVRRKGICIV